MTEIERPRPLAERIYRQSIREAAGISVARLAAAIGVSPSSIYDWENSDSTREPQGLQRRAYADALDQLREPSDGEA